MKTLKHNLIHNAETLVIKVGTNVLTHDNGILNRERIADLVNQLAYLVKMKHKKVILVSSGAIGAGMGKLGIEKRPKTLPDIQALAAVGQSILIEAYRGEFNRHNIDIGQILVTREDFQNRNRYQNISNTLAALLKKKILPIFNENDTVSTDEITFGDNDHLTTLVSHAIRADLVIVLTSTEGLLDMENGGRRIEFVPKIDKKIFAKITTDKSSRGAGGMKSKISAIRQMVEGGEAVILANGNRANVLKEIADGEEVGTFFKPVDTRLPNRKKWIAYSAKANGEILIDEGAKKALLNNRSLLPSGIRGVKGTFPKGSIVRVVCMDEEIARGVVNYSSEEILAVKGLKSKEMGTVLENPMFEEVIHKDNLVVTAYAE